MRLPVVLDGLLLATYAVASFAAGVFTFYGAFADGTAWWQRISMLVAYLCFAGLTTLIATVAGEGARAREDKIEAEAQAKAEERMAT